MSLSTSPEINAYYLDSQFGPRSLTVTHQSAGSTGTGCRGTWQTDIKLNSDRGSTSHVELQTLLPDTLDYDLQKGVQKPFAPVTRAVKRLRTRDAWPEVDHWPMIERGLLCLARANVSDTIAVVRMLGWYQNLEQNVTYIAMEYYPHGNLRDWLRNSPPQDESWAREVIKQVLNVIKELAGAGLAHRNLKPSNILIASVLPIRVKVGDFYNAKWAEENNGFQSQVGALPYVAPEMRCRTPNADPYTAMVDMWALGVILYEILTGTHPFSEPGRRRFSDSVYERFLAGSTPVAVGPVMASVHAVQFVGSLLERDPAMRPSPVQALAAPWFIQPIG